MNSPTNLALNIARLLFVLLSLSMAVALIVRTKSSPQAQGQNQDIQRVVEETLLKNEPIEIAELKLKDKRVNVGQPFLSGDDWLEGMTFKLKNTSGKTLRRVELELEFPEVKLDNATFLFTIHYGQIPGVPDSDSTEMPSVQPGETLEMKFDDRTYTSLRQRVLHGVSVTKARVRISTVIFTNGTSWHNGFWHKQDPNNPRKWIMIDKPSEQNANKDPLRTKSLRHHSAFKPKPPLGSFLEPAQQQCNVTYWGYEYVSCGTAASDSPEGECRGPQVACGSTTQDGYTSGAPHPNAIGSQSDYATICFRYGCICSAVIYRKQALYCPPITEDDGACFDSYDCECDCVCYDGMCSYATPILIDVSGNGFALTDENAGVNFDLNGDGVAMRVAWTTPNSDDAWLVLDRNGNGTIDSGTELFGDVTAQPPSNEPNGFLALAEFDKEENEGNEDSLVDSEDAAFGFLRLWQDKNHNGISEASELRTLSSSSVSAIDLDYRESRKKDRHGNQFRYRAKVYDTHKTKVGRWAWDVALVSRP